MSTTSSRAWHRVALAGTLMLSAFLDFFRLGQEGYANQYYAAAVKSMLTSWHNFFFVSFDPGGFVTVDKPPLGLWVQAISAALFGFRGISLLLPQALAGVLAVAVIYHLVRRAFGPTAALLAALILAVTPISVAANRNNTMDSLLILLLLLAAWAILRAAETGRLRWLLLSMVWVGLGFNVKMLQAFLVLPAFYLLYLLAPPLSWRRRLVHLAVATVVLLAVSLSWAVVVDLTPPEQRPYIGSSQDNTVMELIIGHNGLKRLLPGGLRALSRSQKTSGAPPGQALPPRASGPSGPAAPPRTGSQPNQREPGTLPTQGRGGDRPFSQEIGKPDPSRLFNRQLGGQISWLLPLAGLGLFAAARQTRLRFPPDPRHQSLLLWGVWLLTQVVFFSMANLFHRYYLNILAPAIAVLASAGVVALWSDYRRPGGRGLLLPLTLVCSALVEAHILAGFPEWNRWLTPLVIALCLAASTLLIVARHTHHIRRTRWVAVTAAVGMLALLIAPMVWSLIPVWYGGDVGLPFAGPDVLTRAPQRELSNVDPLVEYLRANRQGETYLVATLNAQDAAPIILATGEPVMALGGFSGGDPILTVDELAELVRSGTIRFFLLPRQAGQQTELARWVLEHGVPVAARLWLGAPSLAGRPGANTVPAQQLFDCGPQLARTLSHTPEAM